MSTTTLSQRLREVRHGLKLCREFNHLPDEEDIEILDKCITQAEAQEGQAGPAGQVDTSDKDPAWRSRRRGWRCADVIANADQYPTVVQAARADVSSNALGTVAP